MYTQIIHHTNIIKHSVNILYHTFQLINYNTFHFNLFIESPSLIKYKLLQKNIESISTKGKELVQK